MSHGLQVMRYGLGLGVAGCGLWVMGYELRVAGCGLWVAGCGLRVGGGSGSLVLSCEFWVAGFWAPSSRSRSKKQRVGSNDEEVASRK